MREDVHRKPLSTREIAQRGSSLAGFGILQTYLLYPIISCEGDCRSIALRIHAHVDDPDRAVIRR